MDDGWPASNLLKKFEDFLWIHSNVYSCHARYPIALQVASATRLSATISIAFQKALRHHQRSVVAAIVTSEVSFQADGTECLNSTSRSAVSSSLSNRLKADKTQADGGDRVDTSQTGRIPATSLRSAGTVQTATNI